MSLIDANRLHRLVKLALDTGEATSLAEAELLFATYKLAIAIGAAAAHSAAHQAALLTAVNAGRRAMLGGVEVIGPAVSEAPLLLPLPGGWRTLVEAVRGLGGRVVANPDPMTPLLVLGDARVDGGGALILRVTFEGWSGGVAPLKSGVRLGEIGAFVPAAILAASVGVAEVFQYLRRSNPAAGLRETGLSLWRPELSWLDPVGFGPRVDRLPSSLWIIGLGNLGQAYLWTLGLLPYAKPSELRLVLQDFDTITESNESTSLLTVAKLVGVYKTRALAAWADRRGFTATIVERRFAANFRIESDEPQVALCGVDNALARTALEDVGFSRVIEAGLGKGLSDYLAFRTHTFPAARTAREVWGGGDNIDSIAVDRPAYRALAAAGMDHCGLTQLAGRTVGAPFVGAAAASLAVSEAVRLAMGAHIHELVDGHLRALDHRTVTVVPSDCTAPFNPGSTQAEAAEE